MATIQSEDTTGGWRCKQDQNAQSKKENDVEDVED